MLRANREYAPLRIARWQDWGLLNRQARLKIQTFGVKYPLELCCYFKLRQQGDEILELSYL